MKVVIVIVVLAFLVLSCKYSSALPDIQINDLIDAKNLNENDVKRQLVWSLEQYPDIKLVAIPEPSTGTPTLAPGTHAEGGRLDGKTLDDKEQAKRLPGNETSNRVKIQVVEQANSKPIEARLAQQLVRILLKPNLKCFGNIKQDNSTNPNTFYIEVTKTTDCTGPGISVSRDDGTMTLNLKELEKAQHDGLLAPPKCPGPELAQPTDIDISNRSLTISLIGSKSNKALEGELKGQVVIQKKQDSTELWSTDQIKATINAPGDKLGDGKDLVLYVHINGYSPIKDLSIPTVPSRGSWKVTLNMDAVPTLEALVLKPQLRLFKDLVVAEDLIRDSRCKYSIKIGNESYELEPAFRLDKAVGLHIKPGRSRSLDGVSELSFESRPSRDINHGCMEAKDKVYVEPGALQSDIELEVRSPQPWLLGYLTSDGFPQDRPSDENSQQSRIVFWGHILKTLDHQIKKTPSGTQYGWRFVTLKEGSRANGGGEYLAGATEANVDSPTTAFSRTNLAKLVSPSGDVQGRLEAQRLINDVEQFAQDQYEPINGRNHLLLLVHGQYGAFDSDSCKEFEKIFRGLKAFSIRVLGIVAAERLDLEGQIDTGEAAKPQVPVLERYSDNSVHSGIRVCNRKRFGGLESHNSEVLVFSYPDTFGLDRKEGVLSAISNAINEARTSTSVK